MRRISTGLSMVVLAATMSCLLLPHSSDSVSTHVATYKPNFSASGIDPMPVGTAKQMARIKRNRAERKA